MPTNKERVVLKKEHSNASRAGVPDWEGARIFLGIARAGSFRAAADALEQSVNSLRGKLDKLERALGTPLLTRHVDGVRLTAEGKRILAAAQRMELASFEVGRGRGLEDAALFGEVKLATTDGLGAFWIAPHLVAYQHRHPNLGVYLHCGMSTVNVFRLEADVSVQFERPEMKDLKIVKLGRLHVMPFVSKSYVAKYGIPKSTADLARHRLTFQFAGQMTRIEQTPSSIQSALRDGGAAMRANTSTAHYFAVANGMGVGMLPTYIQALGASLVPVDINYRTQHDIWLVYHPDAGRIARVQMVIHWLVSMFSPREYPWFGDKFIHPDEFSSASRKSSLAVPNLFSEQRS